MTAVLAFYYCNKVPEISFKRKGLFWVTVLEASEVSVHDQLAC
jgi:hypothetical protein